MPLGNTLALSQKEEQVQAESACGDYMKQIPLYDESSQALHCYPRIIVSRMAETRRRCTVSGNGCLPCSDEKNLNDNTNNKTEGDLQVLEAIYTLNGSWPLKEGVFEG